MKTTIKFLKAILVVVLLFISSTTFADTFYVCNGATLSLAPAATPNVTYSWDVKDLDGTTSLLGYPRAAAPTSLPTTPGTYKVILISTPNAPTVCAPDNVENSFVVLPTLSITLGAPSNASYCETSSTNTSLITQSTSAVPAGSTSDLEIIYSYMVAKDGGTAVDGTTGGLGSIDGTGKYTLSTLVPGSYVITGSVRYAQKTGFTNTFLNSSGTGCAATSGTQTVTVTAKPLKPVITIGAN
ncbi:MAG: hypothetical protein EOO91_09990 [Pedobacter sp.]|nr:MAG: hypothetical protein EOO91_09990 [Pedobacter sp.]